MKILQASLVTHCMRNCLNSHYISLDSSRYGRKFVENRWEPICFEGSSLHHPDYAVDESGEFDESGMAEGSGTINESEIAESEEVHFRGSEGISENYNDQEEHNDTSSMVIFAVIPITMLM